MLVYKMVDKKEDSYDILNTDNGEVEYMNVDDSAHSARGYTYGLTEKQCKAFDSCLGYNIFV